MVDVRAGVDAVDAELVALIAERFGYMRAAARIKTARSAVRDEGRKAQVIANVVREAHLSGVPDPLAVNAAIGAFGKCCRKELN